MRVAALVLGVVLVLSFTACGGSSSGTLPANTVTLSPLARKLTPQPTPPPLPGSRVLSMQLVAPGHGWALTSDRLAWTSDGGGTWRDITPLGVAATQLRGTSLEPELQGTFFLDSRQGWTATIDHTQAMQDAPSTVNIYRTSDGGVTWEHSSFSGPPVVKEGPPLFDVAGLHFVDAQNGWLSGVYTTGLMHHPYLYRTSDGGVTWQQIREPREAYQYAMRFTSPRDGWFAAENPEPLYVTHDGGNSWDSVSLPIPAGCDLAGGGDGSAAPVFQDAAHGTVVVRGLCSGESENSWFYTTSDGGNSWTLASTIPHNIDASIITQSTWVYADDTELSDEISATTDGGAHWQTIHPDWARLLGTSGDPAQPSVYLQSPDFVTPNDGWGLVFNNSGVPDFRLLSATDGGRTWKLLQP